MWIKAKEFKKILGLSNQALYERRKKVQLKFKKVNEVFFIGWKKILKLIQIVLT